MPGSTNSLTFQVNSEAELEAAYAQLSITPGGGTILLGDDMDGARVALFGGGPQVVTIRSEDPENPVSLTTIDLRGVDNVHIEGVDLDNTDPSFLGLGLYVQDSSGIVVSDVTAIGSAQSFYDAEDPLSVAAGSFGQVRTSEDVILDNLSISNYQHGLSFSNSSNVELTNSTLTQLQGDGLRMVGVQDVRIDGNNFHDFLGSTYDYNHDDMIQLWSAGATSESRGIEITNNILDSGEGAATQSIFIRNEMFDTGTDTSYVYEDIIISGNLIYNSQYHGITVNEGANGVTVTDNVVLWNVGDPLEDPVGHMPGIQVNIEGEATVSGNISGFVNVGGQNVAENNLVLEYTLPADPNYIETHLVGATLGTEGAVEDIALHPDSTWELEPGSPLAGGNDAPLILAEADPEDPQLLTLRAVLPEGMEGNPVWNLPGGIQFTGAQITHSFSDPGLHNIQLSVEQNGVFTSETAMNVVVDDSDLLMFDFNSDLADDSFYGATVALHGAEILAGGGLRIGGTDYASTAENDEQLNYLESFGIALDLTQIGSGGHFLRFGHSMIGNITDAGRVEFTLFTDEGSFKVDSGDTFLEMNTSHLISIGYSAENETLALAIDGATVEMIDASGTTTTIGGWQGLFFGSAWNASAEAVIEDFQLSTNPAEVGFAWNTPSKLSVSQGAEPLVLPSALTSLPEVEPEVEDPVAEVEPEVEASEAAWFGDDFPEPAPPEPDFEFEIQTPAVLQIEVETVATALFGDDPSSEPLPEVETPVAEVEPEVEASEAAWFGDDFPEPAPPEPDFEFEIQTPAVLQIEVETVATALFGDDPSSEPLPEAETPATAWVWDDMLAGSGDPMIAAEVLLNTAVPVPDPEEQSAPDEADAGSMDLSYSMDWL